MFSSANDVSKCLALLVLFAGLGAGAARFVVAGERIVGAAIDGELVRGQELDQRLAERNERWKLWDAVLLELIDERLTLRDAADRYGAIFETAASSDARESHEGSASENEPSLQWVIRAARERLDADPARARLVAFRLEQELASYFAERRKSVGTSPSEL
jgi:hypothetical protein